jgi:hypothetical protein
MGHILGLFDTFCLKKEIKKWFLRKMPETKSKTKQNDFLNRYL